MSGVLRLSVVVPAHNGAAFLPRVLQALHESDLPRAHWELIVVDDASTDTSVQVASAFADRIVTLAPPARGPAYARNRGAANGRSDWLVFVDADVVVHRDTLRGFAEAIEETPDAIAVFGAYDEHPPAREFLSQYRNLLHRFVHLQGAGDADTFWSGLGAVKRSAFDEVGGFDERRFPRPQIEDIDLGHRLTDLGGRIILRPTIEATHLKRWRYLQAVRTDIFDRGVPWVRLLLERELLGNEATLNLKRGEHRNAMATALGVLLAVGGAIAASTPVVLLGALLLAAVAWRTRRQHHWFTERRGFLFALATIPLVWQYYLVSSTSVLIGILLHLDAGAPVHRPRRRAPPGEDQPS